MRLFSAKKIKWSFVIHGKKEVFNPSVPLPVRGTIERSAIMQNARRHLSGII